MKIEQLPFKVVRVSNDVDLNSVTQLRSEAYGKHLSFFGETLKLPEEGDFDDDNFVLLAITHDNSLPLATIRIHTNRTKPIPLQSAFSLPRGICDCSLSEAVRLSTTIKPHPFGSLPKNILFKTYYQLCLKQKIEWMLIAARHPLHKTYGKLFFDDITPNNEPIKLSYVNNIPHRILAQKGCNIYGLWSKNNHFLYDLFFNTYHPELENLIT